MGRQLARRGGDRSFDGRGRAASLREERAGSSPDVVAQAILHAVTARRPRVRYPVGKKSRPMSTFGRVLPQRTLDALRLRAELARTDGATDATFRDLIRGVAEFGLARAWRAAPALLGDSRRPHLHHRKTPSRQRIRYYPQVLGSVVPTDAGWSSSVARWAHNPEVAGSNPVPATRENGPEPVGSGPFSYVPDASSSVAQAGDGFPAASRAASASFRNADVR